MKCILSSILLFCLGSFSFATECGDVNSSGKVDIVDALLIAQKYVGGSPSGFFIEAADVNNDKSINIVDALLVAQFYVRSINSLSCKPLTLPSIEPGSAGGLVLNKPVGFASMNGGTSGGAGGKTLTVSSFNELKSYAGNSEKYVIKVKGTISPGSRGGQINVKSNTSIIGIGNSAFLKGVGLNISGQKNIIIRNLKMTLVGTSNPRSFNDGDIISIKGSSRNIWVDHCELYSEDPDKQKNIDKYDGLVDIKNQSGFITISYNYFHDHHKCGIVGSSDSDLYGNRKITFHHNYYRKVKYRMPMYRGSTGHFFNNYIVGARDATEIRAGTCVRVERNYYEALHYSIYTPTDSRGKTERIENIEVKRTKRFYPSDCKANIPYNYSHVLIKNTKDVKTLIPKYAGVGKM